MILLLFSHVNVYTIVVYEEFNLIFFFADGNTAYDGFMIDQIS